MVHILSEADVARVIHMRQATEVVEEAIRQHSTGTTIAARRVSADVTAYPGLRLAAESYIAFLLFSCDTGALPADNAAGTLTGIRTGAASGVRARDLSRTNSWVLGVVGAGVQAKYEVAPLEEVRPLTEARVFDINARKAEEIAPNLVFDLGVTARAVFNSLEAVWMRCRRDRDGGESAPVFDGSWLEDGTYQRDGIEPAE